VQGDDSSRVPRTQIAGVENRHDWKDERGVQQIVELGKAENANTESHGANNC
jgi:hypothetical protein